MIQKLFESEINHKEIHYIEYKTPGVSLAQAILKVLKVNILLKMIVPLFLKIMELLQLLMI